MNAIAPNLTVMVGELVGARLIAHADSLMNLAKYPACTVQILGAEKALFRALKTKHETPKYGLMYHASLIGQAAPKFKGKISWVLAAKSALCIRMDALGDDADASIGIESCAKLEARLRQLEGRALGKISGAAKGKAKIESYDKDREKDTPGVLSAAKAYNPAADSTIGAAIQHDSGKKMKDKKEKQDEAQVVEEVTVVQTSAKKKPKKNKTSKEEPDATTTPVAVEIVQVKTEGKTKKKKVVKEAAEDIQVTEAVVATTTSELKSSKKKRKAEVAVEVAVEEVVQEKKKKKKKKKKKVSED